MRPVPIRRIAVLLACTPLLAIAEPVAPSSAGRETASLRLVDDGVSIEAGSMGKFTLQYPAPGPDPSHPRAIIERTVSGNRVTLKYQGGGAIELTLGPDGTLTMSFASMPSDVKTIRMEMLLDFRFSDGGTWKAGETQEQRFPSEQPPQPYLFQGNADRFTFGNGEGRTLAIEFPRLGFAQLQDNRAWGWRIFDWLMAIPYERGAKDWRMRITVGGVSTPRVRVDRFGQSTSGDYGGKVRTLAALKADAVAEQRWLATLRPPLRDAFGGMPNSGRSLGLRKTGFFHLEQHDAKWFLVDPAGNAFFQLGICSMGPGDDYTYVTGREGNYAWLPAASGGFRTAFRPSDSTAFSFHLANRIRKTGRPFALDDYLTAMIRRARKWGFNSGGAFSPTSRPVQRSSSWPYVGHLPLSRWDGFTSLPGVAGVWDPFDESNRRRVGELFAERVAPHARDPLLIGYFLDNEPLYERLPEVLPTLNGTFACKRRLVRSLQEKYPTIEAFNRSWSAAAKSFDELIDRGLAVGTAAARQDVRDFVGQFLEEYFRLVGETFRSHDKNHLLLGTRFQARTIDDEQVCRISGKYTDVVSINYYSYGIDRELLSRIHGWTGNRPMLLSEFFFSSPSDSRLPGGGKDVATQEQRGLAYRNYVEQAATLGYVVGIEWFALVDQSVTGRYFEKYNGESANTGLISVADRPWKAMLGHMIRTNYGIYDVLLGRRAPFVWNDPRARAGGSRK